MSERTYTKAELKQLIDERAEELVNVFFEELKKDEAANPPPPVTVRNLNYRVGSDGSITIDDPRIFTEIWVQHTPRAVALAMGAFLDIACREDDTAEQHAEGAIHREP